MFPMPLVEAKRYVAEQAKDKDQKESPEAEKSNGSGQERVGNSKPSQVNLFRYYENLNRTTLLSGDDVPSEAAWPGLANRHYQKSLGSKEGSLIRIWMKDLNEQPYLHKISFSQ